MNRRRAGILAALLSAVLVLGLAASASAATTTTARSASATAVPFVVSSANTACQKGERLTMAGFSSTVNDSGQAAFVTAMAPTGTALKASAYNPGEPGTITATAYCSKDAKKKKKKKGKKKGKKGSEAAATAKGKKKKKKKKKKAAPPFTAATATVSQGFPDDEITATATCPAGTTVRAGGFDTVSITDDAYIANEMTMPSPTELTVNVKQFGFDEGPSSVTAIALCGTGPPLTAAPAPDTPIVNNGTATSTATCPAGKKVAFGGFAQGPTDPAIYTGLTRASDTAVSVSAYGDTGGVYHAIAYCG